MRRLWRSRKALSPVVAAIILIAVTVAVSIAVAAWMGALTFTFMKTEELKIVGVEFVGSGGAGSSLTITVRNTGTAASTVTEAKMGDTVHDITDDDLSPGDVSTITVTGITWTNGTSYNIGIVTKAGNIFTYRATSPSP